MALGGVHEVGGMNGKGLVRCRNCIIKGVSTELRRWSFTLKKMGIQAGEQ